MYTLQARQVTGTVILTTDGSTITGGTAVVSGTPSLSDFLADPTVSPTLNSFSVNTATSSSSSSSSSGTAISSSDGNISVQQPISVRTLVAICVAAFVLIAGLVLFVIWFGSRGKRPKEGANEFYADGNNVALDVSKMTTEAKVKAVPVPETNVPLKAGFNSEHSSYYSQGTTRKPVPLHLEHARRPTAESIDPTKLQLQLQDQYRYADEQSFLPKQNVYSRNDMQPVSPPRSARRTDLYSPPTNTNANSINQSPRSTSAQAIVRPYVVGAHPYASPSSGRATSSQGRPSIEHTGNYTVAIAPGTYAGDQPYSANSIAGAGSGMGMGMGMGSEGGGGLGLSGHTTFAGAGSRPGYEAYGIESRQPVVQGLHTRPSLESIRTIARKASIDRTAVATATDFALGGPTAVGSRQRNDSITSSVYRGNVSSTYAGGGGGGGGSIKSGKSGSATKEKYTKQDRAREMAAMENLIAALDESAAKEKQRKRTLAEAAGVADPAPSNNNNNNNNNVVGSRRKDTAVTGSYPLPPAEVFRAALSMADPDDDLDDEEIERWKRR
ncbi:hypothetical protein FRB91_000988 [Serendipita sp. 411]|nr:hypothetical protein FRC18_000689 [Serendipita sp. 400]KAG8846258.1 hypothetical protein FRB91_000988 [Serendipita sp. 411]